MAINNIKSIIHVFLHILMVDQMLFELLHQLRCMPLDTFELLKHLLPDFQNLLINVSTQEVSSLSWVLSRFFDIFNQFLNCNISLFFCLVHFKHHVSNKTLIQVLRLFISLKSWVNLHFDHFRQLFCNLRLLILEGVNIESDIVLSFCNFHS